MIEFYKYEGAGNDFIMIDNRQSNFIGIKKELAKKLCDRHFGIGSDGLIFIELSADVDFLMDFYNPDGSQSFCGNGSRCAVAFSSYLNIFSGNTARFKAIDGVHSAEIIGHSVKVSMQDVGRIEEIGEDFFMNTGSPHYIMEVADIKTCNILEIGKAIRYDAKFAPHGTNVNVIQKTEERTIAIRTYERGVENETLACGTGATACALAFAKKQNLNSGTVDVKAVGGDLKVYFTKKEKSFDSIYLEGPANKVFKGSIDE